MKWEWVELCTPCTCIQRMLQMWRNAKSFGIDFGISYTHLSRKRLGTTPKVWYQWTRSKRIHGWGWVEHVLILDLAIENETETTTNEHFGHLHFERKEK
jgi:hypothetical protein